jgi:hypothetical protein
MKRVPPQSSALLSWFLRAIWVLGYAALIMMFGLVSRIERRWHAGQS